MRIRTTRVALAAAAVVVAAAVACNRTQSGAAETSYADSTVRLIVGFRAGGSFDVQARIVAKYLGQYPPGHPGVRVENMPGAAGVMAAKHLSEVATPDGSTIGLLSVTDVDGVSSLNVAGHFHLLGGPGPPPQIVLFSARSGITTLEAWRSAPRPQRFGSPGPPSTNYVTPLVAGSALGLPVQMVSGYSGLAELRLAFDSGEIDAVSVSVDAYKTAFASAVVRPVLRFSAVPIPGLDAPDAMSVAADGHARDLLETGIYAMAPLVRFYVAPRGAPAGRVRALRDAFMKVWADRQFLADAGAAGITVEAVTADALERLVASVAARPAIVSELRSILAPR